MIENSPPSSNPADDDTLVGAFNLIIEKVLQKLNVMLPARIVAFDRANNVAQVELMVPMVGTDGSVKSRAQIARVPVFQIGSGAAVLNFNLKSGDLGFIKANDRDISGFMGTRQNVKPNTFRTHDFSDGVFFPTALSASGVDLDSDCVLQNSDGSIKISITSNGISIVSSSIVNVVASEINLIGDVHIQGNLLVDGDIAGGANITAAGNITPNTPP